jgi:hypothetical protein
MPREWSPQRPWDLRWLLRRTQRKASCAVELFAPAWHVLCWPSRLLHRPQRDFHRPGLLCCAIGTDKLEKLYVQFMCQRHSAAGNRQFCPNYFFLLFGKRLTFEERLTLKNKKRPFTTSITKVLFILKTKFIYKTDVNMFLATISFSDYSSLSDELLKI